VHKLRLGFQMNQKQANKLIQQINPNYRQFFMASERVTAGKPVLLVEADKFEEFLKAVSIDEDIKLVDRAMIGLLISGSLRVSEMLNIKRNHFDTDKDGNLFVTTIVLKKRRAGVTREIIVHPAIASMVRQHLLTKRGFESLFDCTRIAVLKRIKRIFGEVLDCHAFRHAGISRQIFSLGWSTERVAKLTKLSPRVVEAYSHLNERKNLKELFAPNAAKKSA
jgi:integrase